jgi:hypothetical protein
MRRALPTILAALLLASCRTGPWRGPAVGPGVRFLVETAATPARGTDAASAGDSAAAVVLPQSAVRIAVRPDPALGSGDFAALAIADRGLGRGLLFTLNADGVRRFADLSSREKGRRLVLMSGDRALGVRRLDTAAAGGEVLVFVEVADEDLPALLRELKSVAGPRIREGLK